MSNTFKLNCFVVGSDPKHIFSIEIPVSKTVYTLKTVIKEKRKPEFDDVDTDYVDIWKVDLPVDSTLECNLGSLKLDPRQRLFSVVRLSKLFLDLPETSHLNIVVQRAPSVPPNISLNCLILGDDPKCIFQIEISWTETVVALGDLIRSGNTLAFRHLRITDNLTMWSVSCPVDDKLEYHLNSLNSFTKEPLSPAARMFEVFPNLPHYEHLHIVIRPSIDPSVNKRYAYLPQRVEDPPWYGTQSSILAAKRGQNVYPPDKASHFVPLTLLEPIFAQFVDDFQNYRPTDEDNRFVRELSERMSFFYPDRYSGMDVLKEVLNSYGISAQCVMSVDEPLSEKFMAMITKGRNGLENGGLSPFLAEANYYYYLKFTRSLNNGVPRRSVLPLFHVIVFGKSICCHSEKYIIMISTASRALGGACIYISGSVFTARAQTDVLVPIIPLFWHPTDLLMQGMAARTFRALKIATKNLEGLYSTPIPSLTPEHPSLECPYPRYYIDASGLRQGFSYHEVQNLSDRLIFSGTTENGAHICMRFVRKYSPEAHRFCARRGHAPELLAYEYLPGGWGMVVMDILNIRDGDDHLSPLTTVPYRKFSKMAVADRQLLEKAITDLIHGLHAHGYVHGDLRDANLFARDSDSDKQGVTGASDFMILDFEWAGRIDSDETRYPMNVNRKDIHRPLGAQDGMKIEVDHDLEMLRYVFHPDPSWDDIS
ncbi:hypothetical protein AZE42_06317 [Rhizopogon vesiculosus]|uniref:Protein kinase domain-containing protein n=1 Tax=Rhizopogon vesiculosus TaxID=180088 RepID=A0A1J8PRF9_9AGAM|nr:hypothetical protein AZE42_06317 [Rhizopogon vesiculosus]